MDRTARTTTVSAGDETTSGARVAGNARLTAMTGVVLLALFIAQVVTVVLGVTSVLMAHVVIGLVLTPVVALKMGSTGWQMVQYYRGDADFRTRGAPSMYFRLLGPPLTVFTAVLVCSGLLTYIGPGAWQPAVLMAHKVSFYLWLIAVVLHTVPHYLESVRLVAADTFSRSKLRLSGARARQRAVLAAILIGGALALSLAQHAADYLLHYYPR
jgi:hypothetical protein